MTTAHPSFLEQESQQTLSEAREEYFSVYDSHLQKRTGNPSAAAFFSAHDTAHVVFGGSLSLADEAAIKIYSMFGTTEGYAVLKGYALAESREIYGELGVRDILATMSRSVTLVPRTIYRARQMTMKWPWLEHSQFDHTPLATLRSNFGISVIYEDSI